MTTRRKFLQTTATITGALVLPRSLFGQVSSESSQSKKSFLFIHNNTLETWSVADPVQWCLDHKNDPILERASEGLSKLSMNDGERIIRLVVRRCRMNLLEFKSNQITMHYWGQQYADFKPFFKSNGLARQDIEVVMRDRKREAFNKCPGDSFQYGDPLDIGFPLELFQSKWQRRFEPESDDWKPAPGTRSGMAWDNLEDGLIPWGAMKSAWRRSDRSDRSDRSNRSGLGVCLNCDQPTLLTNFGQCHLNSYSSYASESEVCGRCRKQFCRSPVIAQELDAEWRPKYRLILGKRKSCHFPISCTNEKS